MKYRKYLPIVYIVIALLLINSFNSYAQFTPPDLPCDPEDPSCPAPLDTWVIVLVIAALVFTTLQLHRQQKGNKVSY